jgi:ribonuclease-3
LIKLLGFKPGNKQIYTQALQHKSFDNINNNERLEFLGDAILNFVVSEYLFSKNPNQEEGFLSQQRAIIVGRKHLNKIGKKTINSSKIKSSLKTIPESVFGNTLEAIIGAIYIDKGIEKTKQFIIHTIINSEFIEEFSGIDFKSELQKQIQKKKQKIKYKLVETDGPDHNKEFNVAVYIDSVNIAQAKASSIKEAEQKAAKKALNSVF